MSTVNTMEVSFAFEEIADMLNPILEKELVRNKWLPKDHVIEEIKLDWDDYGIIATVRFA